MTYKQRAVTPLREKIQALSMPIPWSGCWLWLGTAMKHGYGSVGLGRRHDGTTVAHRAAWLAFKGQIPDGLHVLHRCDVRCCVNPDHLFLGTHLENVRDMDRKGRRITPNRAGSRNGQSLLTEDQAREIKHSKDKTRHLMARFNVSRSVVQQIRSGRCWRHV